jgi:hypothetical protein
MDEPPKRYALRYSPRALRDLEAAIIAFADFTAMSRKRYNYGMAYGHPPQSWLRIPTVIKLMNMRPR